MKKIVYIAAVCVLTASSSGLWAKGDRAALPDNYEMINAPTAYTLARGSYDISLRFYGGGGLYSRIHFGFMWPLLIGVGFTVNNAIGSGDMSSETPRLGLRLRVLNEKVWPSIAIGWDQRGYGGVIGGHYAMGEKGTYIVFSKEVKVFGSLQLHGGSNILEIDNFDGVKDIRFFGGITAAPIKEIIFDIEADDLFDNANPGVDQNGNMTDFGGNPSLNARVSFCFDEMLTIAIETLDLTGDNISRSLLIQYKNYF